MVMGVSWSGLMAKPSPLVGEGEGETTGGVGEGSGSRVC